MEFTHLDARGEARMVDVTAKQPTVRSATAVASVRCSPEVVDALRAGTVPKGDVLAVARVAGIAATKKVPDLLPLAHVIGVHGAVVDLEIVDSGVTMVALLALSDSGASLYDANHAAALASLGVPAFACTPDLFPDLMAAAIERRDLGQWAATNDIVTAAPDDSGLGRGGPGR